MKITIAFGGKNSRPEVLGSAGSTEELTMTMDDFSSGLSWWRVKTCPSLMAEVILPASTQKRPTEEVKSIRKFNAQRPPVLWRSSF